MLRHLVERREGLVEEIGRGVAAIQERGPVIKDLSSGLIDFYSIAGDRLIFLCWRMGEKDVSHWHTLEGGFANRQPPRPQRAGLSGFHARNELTTPIVLSASARPFSDYAPLDAETIRERTWKAKRALGSRLVILGHHYQRESVIEFADHRGDSLKLSQLAAAQGGAEYIVFCGVHFMAESADVLRRPARP